MTGWPLLSLTIWLPILGGLWVLFAGARAPANAARNDAFVIALVTFLLSIGLYTGFDASTSAMQFVERVPWISAFDIEYYLGIDGLSLPLILLTTLVTVLVVIAAWQSVSERVHQYLAAFLILEGLMVGVFAALDAILFYVFFEAMLVPMFLIIGIWGGPRRVYATLKFFLYTFLGSVFMLVSLLYLYVQAGSFEIADYYDLPLAMDVQKLIFLAFFAAFAIKIPMWPVHTWLPDAHVEAPTGGSVILAAVMLKIGGYGFLRFSLPIVPDASTALAPLVVFVSLVAIVYIGFVALVQTDMKKLIAYSSISHMGFVTLGIFIGGLSAAGWSQQGVVLALEGGIVQMISHGFISGALFLCIGVLYDRLHSREISSYGGVANTMPHFSAFLMLFAMANSGLPATSGFVGEFLVILGTFQVVPILGAVAALTLILGAAYTLWLYKRVVFGEVANAGVAALSDITAREKLVLAVLAALVLGFGVWPDPLLEVMHATVSDLVAHVDQSKLP